MGLADDTNAPIRFRGQEFHALTMKDIGKLIEALPARLVPRQLLPFVTVTDAMKFGRSPFGLPILMDIVSKNSGHDVALGLSPGDQLQLAAALVDRFYGFDIASVDVDDDDDATEAEPKEAFQEGPAS